MLLNVCCAPCCLPLAAGQGGAKTLYFYSPNIYPREEYDRRLGETKKVAALYGLELFEGEYDHDNWLAFLREKVPGELTDYPENSVRCRACFQYRLNRTAMAAKERGFKVFATTLSLNRFKDVVFIDQYGKWLAERFGLEYQTFDLDPAEAHQQGRELTAKHNIYRQKYCGCEFSVRT